ncbi:hypothetical protein HAX54_033025 [Datura stramonium]|uniref:Uncharacterized protein n=1 Tax=Datura stramonium TaxID=4076 RepID=A0ABS8VBL4_DATST|nr:hypothetical protein [Datura stramonium]
MAEGSIMTQFSVVQRRYCDKFAKPIGLGTTSRPNLKLETTQENYDRLGYQARDQGSWRNREPPVIESRDAKIEAILAEVLQQTRESSEVRFETTSVKSFPIWVSWSNHIHPQSNNYNNR